METNGLIERVNRDPEAFSEIVDAYSDKLLRYVVRISGLPEEEAENLVQEILIKTYRHINEYDSRWSFSSWIYRIAHNAVIDDFRKRKNETPKISLESEEYSAIVDSLTDGKSPKDELARSDVKDCVRKAVSLLPSDYSEAIVLKCLEGYSYEEISDILKIPIGTASTLVNR